MVYEPPRYVEPRTSKLAVTSLVLSICISPLLVAPKMLGLGARWMLLILATAVSIVAVARMRASRGELRRGVAWAALIIPLLWWVLAAALFVLTLLVATNWQD
jgi:hypothetical protein